MHPRTRPTSFPSKRGSRFASLLLSLFFAGTTASAASPMLGGSKQIDFGAGAGPIEIQVDHNVASPALARFLPNSAVSSHWVSQGLWKWERVQTLSLFAVTERGMSSRTWRDDVEAWSDWTHLGNPSGLPVEAVPRDGQGTGFDFSLPLVRGWDASTPDWIGYQALRKPYWGDYRSQVAIMELDAENAQLQFADFPAPPGTASRSWKLPKDWNHVMPHAALESIDPNGTNRYRRHVFGNAVTNGDLVEPGAVYSTPTDLFYDTTLPLIEMRHTQNGGPPLFIDHGEPYDYQHVVIGPNSAVAVRHLESDRLEGNALNEKHYVFVGLIEDWDEAVDLSSISQVGYLAGDGENYAWHLLGGSLLGLRGAPIAVAEYGNRHNDETGDLETRGMINVFIVDARRRELCSIKHDGRNFEPDWSCIPRPRNFAWNDAFTMTTALTWEESSPAGFSFSNVHVIGATDEGNRHGPGILEYAPHINQSGLGWRFIKAPAGVAEFQTTNAQAIERPDGVRLVVLGRTGQGRILEHFREIKHGRIVDEGWKDLSFEPLGRKP